MKRNKLSDQRNVFSNSARSLTENAVCAKRPKRGTNFKRERTAELIFIWGILAMSLIPIGVFWVYGNFSAILMAFEDPDTGFSLVNFKNIWQEIQTPGSELLNGVKNTLIFFGVSFFILTPLNYIFSYFVYKRIKWTPFFRVIFFLPAIISPVVLTSCYKFMFSPDGPMVTIWQNLFGFSPMFFANSEYALTMICIYNIWAGLGPGFLYNVAAMSRIPPSILESARLDGVSAFKELTHIILPLIWPYISTTVFISLTGILGATGPILLFTQGAYNTMTLDYWLFINTLGEGTISMAAAMGVLMTVINLPIALVFKRLADRVEPVEF